MQRNRYILFIPIGGFIDHLVCLREALIYAKRFKRTLLIDSTKQVYKINFCDYFDVRGLGVKVISDIKKIEQILKTEPLTVWPKEIQLAELLKNNYHFGWTKGIYALHGYHKFNSGKPFSTNPPAMHHNVEEDIIIRPKCGGGKIWRHTLNFIRFAPNFAESINQEFNEKISSIGGDYITIQVRNTDHGSQYQDLYERNKHILRGQRIHLATDDASVLDFYKQQKLNIFNFTTFPENQQQLETHGYNGYKPVAHPIHYSNVPGGRQLRDLLIDMALAHESKKFISNSPGGYKFACETFYKSFKTNIINFMSRPW